MASLDLQTISSGTSLDDTTLNNNINLLNAVPLTGTTLNNIPTFSEDEKITAADINEAFMAIKDNWIDTSDATATVNDMANGVTAYVNGEKVKGNVATINSGNIVDKSVLGYGGIGDGSNIFFSCQMSQDILMRSGSHVRLSTPLNNLGDATAADVAAGKTFTSSAGVKKTGTGDICFIERLRAIDVTSNGKTYIANVTFDFDNYSIYITPTDVLDDYTIDRIRRVRHISLEIDIRESRSDYKGQFVIYSANSTTQTLWHWMYIQEYDGELDYYDYGRCSYDMDDDSKVATFSYTMSAWEDALDYMRGCDSSLTANGLVTWEIL